MWRKVDKGNSRFGRTLLETCLVVAFVACLAFANQASASRQGDQLVVPVLTTPKSMDPLEVLEVSTALVLGQIYDTLYEYDSKHRLKAKLVESHDIDSKGQVFRLTLKKDIKFIDGTPLTAKVVSDNLTRAVSKLGSQVKWAFGDIRGFDNFISSQKKGKPLTRLNGIRVVSNHVIEIYLVRSFPQFLQVLTAPYFSIVKEVGGGKFVGTGSYRVANRGKDSITLNLRTDVAAARNAPKSLVFKQTANFAEALQQAKKGVMDFAVTIGQKDATQPQGFRRYQFDYLQTILLQFNTKRITRRKDRCTIISSFNRAIQKSSVRLKPVALGMPFAWHAYYPKLPDRAIASKQKGKPISIIYADSATNFTEVDRAQIRGLLGKLGYEAKFEGLSVGEVFRRLKSGDFDISLWGYIPDYIDPDALLTPLVGTGQQYNFSQYSNEYLDSLLDLARSIPHQYSRNLVFQKTLEQLAKDCPIAYLGTQPASFLLSESWSAPAINGLGIHTVKFRDARQIARK